MSDGMTLHQLFSAWDLYGDTLVAAGAAGGLLGFLGAYVVSRRLVFVSAALSQAAGLGVVLAHWLALAGIIALPPTLGALALALMAAAGFLGGREDSGARGDGLLGWVYLVGGAGTLVVGAHIVQELPDIKSVLFGTAVAVTAEDCHRILVLTGGLLLVHGLGFRGFVEVTLDRTGARIRGLPIRTLEVVLLLSLALAISVTTRILGALPVFAFSVLPALAALRVAANLPRALLLAGILGALAGFWGYVLASSLALPVGATQTLLAAAFVPAAGVVGGAAERFAGHRWRGLAFGVLVAVAAVGAGAYAVAQVAAGPAMVSDVWEEDLEDRATTRPHPAAPDGDAASDPWAEDLRLRDELYTLLEDGLEEHCTLGETVNAWYAAHEGRVRELCLLMDDLPLDDPQTYMDASVRHAKALGGPVKDRVWALHLELHEATGGCEHLRPLEELVHRYDQICR